MKNQKGFSLVEVLTVIVVLAIIMAIAVPRVLVSIDNVRKETFRTGATSIVDTVKLLYSQKYKKMTESKTYTFDRGNYAEDSEELALKGDLPYGGQVYLNTEGEIALAVISPNKKWCAKKNLNDKKITIEDYNPGYCVINIDEENIIGEDYYITITVSDEDIWTKEKTVTIESNSKSSNIANGMKLYYKYVPSSSLKKAKEIDFEEYSGTFEAEENGTVYAELRSDKTTIVSGEKKIVKIDNTTPTCKFSIEGTKSNTGWYTSDEVTVILGGIDNQSGINDGSIKIGTDSDNLNSTSITIKDNGETNIYGTVSDNVGNTETCSTTIKKDSTTPSCTLEVKSGTIGNQPWYTSNVTVGFKSRTYGTSGKNGFGIGTSTNYDEGTSLTISNDGTKTVYGYVKNNAGKTKKCSVTIYKDATAPTCSYSGTSTTWIKGKRTIKTTCTDNTSGCKVDSISNLFTETTKTSKISNTISDLAGNKTTCSKTVNVYLDNTKPKLGSATFTKLQQASYKITVTGSDANSGVKNYTYKVSSNSISNTTDNWFVAEAVAPITVTIKDKANNSNSKIYTIDALDAYLRQLYKNALGRDPDASGLNHWKNEYNTFLKANGGKSIDDVIISIYTSDEAQTKLTTKNSFVKAMYKGILGRDADESGLNSWKNKLSSLSKTDEKTVLESFLKSDEFSTLKNFYGFVSSVSYSPSTYAATTTYTCPDYWSLNDEKTTCSTVESYGCSVGCKVWKSNWKLIDSGSKKFEYYGACPGSNKEVKTNDANIKYGECEGHNCGNMGTPYSVCNNKYQLVNELVETTCSSTCERTVTQAVQTNISCNNDSATLKGTTCYYCPKGGSYNSSTNKCVIE